jgi:superfamily II DNA helicase RecQ
MSGADKTPPMSSLSDELVSSILNTFGIEQLTQHQEESIKAVMNGQDVFLGTRTGSSKSSAYECLPLLWSEQSTVLVIAPLLSIMKEQVERLQKLNFTATFIGMDSSQNDAIKQGMYQFVFCSPVKCIYADSSSLYYSHYSRSID